MIETGSYPDLEDKYWNYLMVFEIIHPVEGDEETKQALFTGFLSFYEFYQTNELKRNRLSQEIILPPYQRLGLGYLLLSVNPPKFTKNLIF